MENTKVDFLLLANTLKEAVKDDCIRVDYNGHLFYIDKVIEYNNGSESIILTLHTKENGNQ